MLLLSISLFFTIILDHPPVYVHAGQCGIRQIKTRHLLTNGYDTQAGDYPWHTAVYQIIPTEQYICGGTLITSRAVFTSAHCAARPGLNTPRPSDELLVKLGKYTLDEDSPHVQPHSIDRIVLHDEFKMEEFRNDVALLVTKEKVTFGTYVQPVCLPANPSLRASLIGTVVGWGYTEGKKVANVLRAASAPIVSHRVCLESNLEAFGRTVDETVFCAGWRNGTNPCNGDSGGGLFIRSATSGTWTLLGVVAFAASDREDENFCSTSDYTVYVDVSKYVEWIRAKLKAHDRPPTGCNTNEGQKRYVVHNNRNVTFLEAWRLCQTLGFRLATITSQDDSQAIAEAIVSSSNTKGPWWIGGTDLGSEGLFVWISTNQVVGFRSGYLNYSPGQPDNAGGNENCLEIGRWGGVVWNDVPCDWKQRYICEHVV
ncbi:serine protease [Anopheles sinensis]|uniref:Serine protease n=1 Tax=Anopheles sinensis TaxID=74873 RepID=A0A084VJW5_ANOSI|nr:serine protease [Anopheles sinensis]